MNTTIRRSAGLVLLCFSIPAAAALGDDLDSVAADGVQLGAAPEIAGTGRFSLYQMRLASGTLVREYVSPSGMVFAVTWQGPALPDLQQILGRYFEEYAASVRQQDAGTRTRRAQGTGLVVESGGHMRAFFGRARLQQMLPRGVTVEEIR